MTANAKEINVFTKLSTTGTSSYLNRGSTIVAAQGGVGLTENTKQRHHTVNVLFL